MRWRERGGSGSHASANSAFVALSYRRLAVCEFDLKKATEGWLSLAWRGLIRAACPPWTATLAGAKRAYGAFSARREPWWWTHPPEQRLIVTYIT